MNLLTLQRDFECWLRREPAELPTSFADSQRPGLAVYLNNYRSQLLACLASSYPVTRSLLGEDTFEALAARHIDACAPHSWTLDAYADGFPRALSEQLPTEPHIAELAALELALATAFVGADATPIDSARLADVDWESAVLRLAPTFTFLRVTTNADVFWSAISDKQSPPRAERLHENAWLAIWRSDFVSRFRTALPAEAIVFERVREGLPFGRICTELVQMLGEAAGTAAAGAALGRWLADGVVVSVAGMKLPSS